jgi:toxin CcdB
MAQFSVYKNENPKNNKEYPYLLNVQNDILSSLDTCMVVPLSVTMKPIKHLNPVFEIGGKNVVMSTTQMAGIDKTMLNKEVTNLETFRREIIDAIDFMIVGF